MRIYWLRPQTKRSRIVSMGDAILMGIDEPRDYWLDHLDGRGYKLGRLGEGQLSPWIKIDHRYW